MTKKQHCIRCSRKDPCVTVYHGTSVNSISSIRRDGMKDQYATTDASRAAWFGRHYGRPVLTKIRTPISKLRWTDQDHDKEDPVELWDLKHEKDFEDQYLFIKGKIKPCQIIFLPRKELIKKVAKERRKWQFEFEDLDI